MAARGCGNRLTEYLAGRSRRGENLATGQVGRYRCGSQRDD